MARSILLVDDDADTRMMLRDFLEEEGFIVHTAREGQHALHVLEKIEPPDLILLDYKMPVMDGKQFLGVQRRMPKCRRCRLCCSPRRRAMVGSAPRSPRGAVEAH